MAVQVLPRSRARVAQRGMTVPPGVLALVLVAPALDVLRTATPGIGVVGSSNAVTDVALLGNALAAAALTIVWLRCVRASWLFAAALAALAAVALRLVGADVAPILSVLAILALGVGGGFSTSQLSLEGA